MKFAKIACTATLFLASAAQAEITVPLVQLPYKSPAQLKSLIKQDDARFNWTKAELVLNRYLPAHYKIHEGRGWASAYADCYNNQSVVPCKRLMSYVVWVMERKEELGLTRMLELTLDDVPYRDPAPIEELIEALHVEPEPTVTKEETRAILLPYLEDRYVVDTAAGSSFNDARITCMFHAQEEYPPYHMAPFYVYCREYAAQLAALMYDKQETARQMMINPF